MEGVLVSAKGVGSHITVTVVSDSQGRYAFPPGRLKPGKYDLAIRAAGYDLTDPGVIEVSDGSKTVDLALVQTRNLAPQLMNAEWLMSMPGTREEKLEHADCVGCHSLHIVTRTGHDTAGFINVLKRMGGHNPGSSPIDPTYSASWEEGEENGAMEVGESAPVSDEIKEQAAYLASINQSTMPIGDHDKWPYELKTLPRPKGKATRVIITEYAIARENAQPHDAGVDPEGIVWYGDFGENVIGRLDPRTGEIKEFRYPLLKQRPYSPGVLDVKIDREGNPWFGLLQQGGLAKMDRKTETITTWSIPPEYNNIRNNVGQIAHSSDGVVWFKSSADERVFGLDLKTNQINKTHKLPRLGFYGMEITSKNVLYLFGLSSHVIGELDTNTGKLNTYPTPTPKSGPRRGDLDPQERAWFAYYRSGGFGMFDPATKQFKEWPTPEPFSDPYDLVVDQKHGDVWAGGMKTDYVYRLNPTTGEIVGYLLPTVNANIRRMDMDWNTTPVSIWIGENHGGKIVRVEPID